LYNFKFKSLVDFFLYLPLAIPTYIMAFSYGEILSFTGPFQLFLRIIFLLYLHFSTWIT
jgi:iron(III) transport system permease protein